MWSLRYLQILKFIRTKYTANRM